MMTITINVKFQCAVIQTNARLQEERHEGLEAVHRADIHAVGVPALDAGFSNHMCHSVPPAVAVTELTNASGGAAYRRTGTYL